MIQSLDEAMRERSYVRPQPGDARWVMWDENGQARYRTAWWTKVSDGDSDDRRL